MRNSLTKPFYLTLLSGFLSLQTFAASPLNPVFSTVATFTGANGAYSVSPLTVGKNGALFGTTYSGGTYGYGTVFELTGSEGAFTLTTIYSFTGYSDGSNPQSGLVMAAGGAFYGTTEFGGTFGLGTVFTLQPPSVAGGTWTEVVLHSFQGGSDGEFPYAGVVVSSNKVLYGVTNNGGPSGDGTVFQLIPGASESASVETVLYAFAGNADGGNPTGSLLIGKAGVLYGTTFAGGLGSVFELAPPSVQGGSWTKTIIHSFQGGSDGSNPQAGLIAGSNGALFGTTYLGGTLGTTGHGTVYELIPPAKGATTWTEVVLHSFASPNDGLYAEGSLTLGPKGVLYGTTNGGGLNGSQSQGTVFALTPPAESGTPWTETILVTFDGVNGNAPDTALVAYKGTLYSTTRYGGSSSNNGTVFALAF